MENVRGPSYPKGASHAVKAAIQMRHLLGGIL